MADLAPVYDALKKADAAGDSASAKQLADYIRSQTHTSQSFDSVNGQLVPTGGPGSFSKTGPLDGNNEAQNSLIGYGKFLTDTALGAKQMVGAASPQDAVAKRALDAPIMQTAGGNVGYFGGGLVNSIPAMAIPGANTVAGAALVGGTMGALQPADSVASRYQNIALGGVLGSVGQRGSDMVKNYILRNSASDLAPMGLNAAQNAAASSGQNLGMRLTPGQATGNKSLQQFEAKLESQPWSSGPFHELKANNQGVLNNAWAGAIGESGNSVDSAVLANAHDRLGQVFDSVRSPDLHIMQDPAHTSGAIDSIDQQFSGLLPGGSSIRQNPLVSQLETLTGSGSVTGEQLGQLSSKLGKAAYKQMTTPGGDRDMGQALYAVKNHVDDTLQSSLSGPQADAYGSARQQYRALMQLTSRVGNVNPTTGDVGGGALANYLQQTDRNGYLFGGNQSDAYNAARFSQAFKPIVGNSGTATRSPMGLKDWALSIPGNLASRAYLSTPGASAAIRAVAAPDAISRSLRNGALPFVQDGLPGVSQGLIPYLTQ